MTASLSSSSARLPHKRARPTFGWPAWCFIALVLGTSYRLRLRPTNSSVEGIVDFQIVLEVLIYAGVGAFLLTRLRFARRGRPRPLAALTWVYALLATLSVLYSPIPTFALVRTGQLAVALVFLVAIEQATTGNQLHGLLHAFVMLAAASSVAGHAIDFTFAGHIGQYTWWNMHPNVTGMLLAIAVVATVSYAFDARHRELLLAPVWTYRLLAAFLAVSLVLTQSRTAITGAVIATSVLLVCTARRRVDAVVVGTIVVTIATVLGLSSAQTFLRRGQNTEDFESLSNRTEVWDWAVDKIAERPLLGHGYGAARTRLSSGRFDLGGTHNAFLEVAIDAGVVVVALLAVVVVGTMWKAWAAQRSDAGDASRDAPVLLAVVILLGMQSLTEQGLGQAASIQTLWLFLVIGWLLNISPPGRRTRRHTASSRVSVSRSSSNAPVTSWA